MAKHSFNGVTNRRKVALKALEAQLKAGTKPCKRYTSVHDTPLPLEEKDIKRIHKEIETLKSKI